MLQPSSLDGELRRQSQAVFNRAKRFVEPADQTQHAALELASFVQVPAKVVVQARDRGRFEIRAQRQPLTPLLLREPALAAPVQQVALRAVRAGKERLVAAALRRVDGGAVVDLGLGQLALPPAGDAQAVVDRAEHMQRQVGHRPSLQHARQRRGIGGLNRTNMPVQPADHRLLVDPDLLGRPPLLETEFGDAVAQPRAVERDGRHVDRWKKLRHHQH